MAEKTWPSLGENTWPIIVRKMTPILLSSPRMRSAPQVAFSLAARTAAIRLIKAMTSSVPPEKIAMPAQHGVRLHNDQCLFPAAQLACQENDEGPIAPGQRLSFAR
jgi:hypothetical protein